MFLLMSQKAVLEFFFYQAVLSVFLLMAFVASDPNLPRNFPPTMHTGYDNPGYSIESCNIQLD